MTLLHGKYRNITKCEAGTDERMCLVCNGTENDDDYNNFTMTDVGFESKIDYVVDELAEMRRT